MSQILTNCLITHKDSEIVKSYDIYAGSGIYHTGIDIRTDSVYCPCQGVVIYDGLVEKQPSCTVQYSQNICLRFTHLKSLYVTSGQIIEAGQEIGIADSFVHFEYLTSEQWYPNFRIFFNAYENSYYMYKHDPYLVLNGNIQFEETSIPRQEIIDDDYEARFKAFLEMQKIDPNFFQEDESYSIFNSDLFDDLSGD